MQTFERLFREVQSTAPRDGSCEHHSHGHLTEFVIQTVQYLCHVFTAIAHIYDGTGPEEEHADDTPSHDSDLLADDWVHKLLYYIVNDICYSCLTKNLYHIASY